MNYQEALAFIHKKNNFAASPGLERMQRLCELLGNPQDGMKFVHVAGTNRQGFNSHDDCMCAGGRGI